MDITSNINTKPFNYPSLEYISKFDPSAQKKILDDFVAAQKERAISLKKISEDLSSGRISKQKFKEQKQKIEDSISATFHRSPIPQVDAGKNGQIVAEHKNSFGIIFIGDTKQAEENINFDINAPKMCFAVGGSLEASYNPLKNSLAQIDPKQDYIPQASAQVHLISKSDIDTKGILAVPELFGRSSVRAEADILEMYSKEAVIIRSLGRPYLSSGAVKYTPGGVHIISGQNSILSDLGLKDPDLKQSEPMVLGQSLVDCLVDITKIISELTTTTKQINNDLITLKGILASHVHVVGTVVSAPNPELITHQLVGIANDILNTGNLASYILNLEILASKYLFAFSSQKFLSEFNRVN